MTTVPVRGGSLEYVEHGTGEPLVLVHGSASDLRTWRAIQNVFAERYRTIAYSRRYHWPNSPIPDDADYSMREHVDDLRTVIEGLDAAPAHLVGHSYGAFLCLLLAIETPSLVRTLVLTEPPAVTLFVSDPPRPVELLRLAVTRPRTLAAVLAFGTRGLVPATKAARRGDLESAIRIFGTAILGREAFARLSEERREQVRANTLRAEFTGSGFAPLPPDRVRSIDVPTLLITSEHGAALFRRIAQRLTELMGESRQITIRGTSHIVHEDDPTSFAEAILSFLAEQ